MVVRLLAGFAVGGRQPSSKRGRWGERRRRGVIWWWRFVGCLSVITSSEVAVQRKNDERGWSLTIAIALVVRGRFISGQSTDDGGAMNGK